MQLRDLESDLRGERIRLADVFSRTQGRGYYLFMLLFSLPFLTPIPTPMLSTVFGGAIFFIALRLMLGQAPWLPQRFLNKPLPNAFISRLISAASHIVSWLEKLMRPRLAFMHSTRIMDRVGAGVIAFAAFLLMLPIPVPFSNCFPAAAILLLSAGALERDGLCSLAGWFASVVAAVFTAGIAIGGATFVDRVGQWFT
ncbi:MAG: exopolysaccharide biosynthesis protein [Verrucomicrobiota bacterium]